ncbi:uncharacterized protein LOC134346930 isoform X2 [Mobula hypostoma]
MWHSRIQSLLTFYCLYTMVTCLISAPCYEYIDLEGKVGMNCSNQYLDSVPASLLSDTEILLLSFNNITSVSLSSFGNLNKLHDLDLSNNQIRHFNSDDTLSVQKLDLSSNALTTIPDFRKLPLLRKLVLDVNQISTLPERAFEPLVHLEDLSIKGNAIISIPDHIFDPLVKLRYLTLSANRIEEFPKDALGRLEELQTFDISNNKLRTIPEDFFENNVLFYAFLYNNPWDCECSTVSYLKGWIDENDGNIYKVVGEPDSETVVCATPTTWQGTPIINLLTEQICPSVTTELMTPTNLVHGTVTTFHKLFLQTSRHQEICAQYIDRAGKVGMNCSHRSLDSVPLILPTDTEVLLLNFNAITSVSFSSFRNLTKLYDLDLSNNQIRHLHSDVTLPVQKLDVSSNVLATLPDFRKLPLLRKLVLDVNQISTLPERAFEPLVHLEDLSIKGNAIISIPDHIFDPLVKLRYLTLSANRIEEFPKDALGRLEELQTFDISNNKLRTIPEDFFENNVLFYAFLYNNPWDCECSTVSYLKGWIDENDGNIYKVVGEPDSETVVCATPTAWQGTPIINLLTEQICPSVTTELMTPTNLVHGTVTTFHKLFLQTSRHQEICAQYIDRAGKVGMNCSHRSLDSVPLILPTDTEVLLLNFNAITSVSFSSFRSLTKLYDLDLSNNQIRHLHSDDTLPVQKLDVSSNVLATLPDFRKLPLLRKLVLDVNQISTLPERAFEPLVHLEDLSIKGNAIISIPDHIFDPLVKLRYLTLSANRIEEFPKDALGRLEELQTFDISNNKLRTIPEDFFENNVLFYAFLYNNPWDCECSTVSYLKGWIDENDGNIYKVVGEPDSETVVCATPTTWQGTPIINLLTEQICPSVTTELMTPTNLVHGTVTTFHKLFLQTSRHQEICAQYIDRAGKVGMNCSHRSLDSVPLILPTDTEVLLLNFNAITSVSFSSFRNLTKLYDLDLSNNQIRHLHSDVTLPVQKLDVSSNVLATLPDFRKLPLLRKLVLDVNQISTLPERAFEPLVHLEDLSIKGNAIISIPDHIFDPLVKLRYLTLSANRIEEFPKDALGRLEELQTFDISNNKLRTIPEDFFENNVLFYAFLYNNPWDCECSTVSYLKGWIDENDGNIYKVVGEPDSETVVCATPTAWQGTPIINLLTEQICPSVTTELMTPTNLVHGTVTTFHKLFLQTSRHQEICAQYIDRAGKVGMNCSHRSLDSVPLILPTDTEVLLLNFNAITSVSFSSFRSLTKLYDLDLSNNQIRHLHSDDTLPVQKLDVSSNVLATLPDFRKLPLLRKLVLDVNQISTLPERAFEPLVHLEDLSIKGNAIISIPDHIFDPLVKLRYLTLSANRIEEFPKDALGRLEELQTFDISNNKLRTIPEDFFENNVLFYAFLYNNPWDCECSTVSYLKGWIDENDGNIYKVVGEPDSETVVCATPTAWQGTPIINLLTEQICPSVTMELMTPTNLVHGTVTTFHKLFLQTSRHQEICAQYIDRAGKVGMNCSHQSLDSVPLILPTDTEVLLLNFNAITSVSFSSFRNLTKLYDLDLSNNQIRHLHSDDKLPVQKLDLSSNVLATLPDFRNLPFLRKLVLDVNEISALPQGAFEHLVNLEDLSIKGNAIISISDHIFDPLVKLRYLTLSANKIEQFPKDALGRLENLETLDISSNVLRTIPQGFFEHQQLPYVFLYNNPWDCECSTVSYLKGWIDENDGNIYKVAGEPDSETVVCETPTTWQGTPMINLTAEQICPSVTTEMTTLRTTVDETRTTFDSLFLQTSPPQKICAQYINLAGGMGINCSHRSLNSVPLSLPTDTEVLLLSSNAITSIFLSSFKNLSQLHDLDLANNQIRNVHGNYTLSVQKLDISSNALTTIPNFSNLPHLRRLVLDDNKISVLPEGAFEPLVNLEDLSIKGNAIAEIPDDIFDPLKNLRHLTLSANKIREFPKDALSSMEILQTLDISSNVLRTIPQGLFEHQRLLHVLLYDNPWDCDCSIHYMAEWINVNRDKVYRHAGVNDSTSVTCNAPPELDGIPLIQVAIDQICAVTTSITSAPVSTPAAPSDPSPDNTFTMWARRSGLLEFFQQLQRNCLLLFTLLCLSLGLVLFEISALSFYILRFHQRLYRPLRQLSRRSWYIRLVRYSLVLPYLQQIYPPPRAAFSRDATEATPLEGEEWTSNATEAAGDAFTSFL